MVVFEEDTSGQTGAGGGTIMDPIVLGGAAGGVVLLCCCCIILVCVYRRRRHGAILREDEGKRISIRGDVLEVDGKQRAVHWDGARHHDLSGVIAAKVQERFKGAVKLQRAPGQGRKDVTFQNPRPAQRRDDDRYAHMPGPREFGQGTMSRYRTV